MAQLLLTVALICASLFSWRIIVCAQNSVGTQLSRACNVSGGNLFLRMARRQSFYPRWLAEASVLLRENGYDGNKVMKKYFYDRPVYTPMNSVCAPMNTTCCRPNTEKHVARISAREISELFLNVTQENLGKCFKFGRKFYNAVFVNFNETRRQLELPIKALLENKMPPNLFDGLFSYLQGFFMISNICDLAPELNLTMSKIFDFVYDRQPGQSLRESHSECYQNVSEELMSETRDRLFLALERQLYNLDLIYRAMEISEIVVERIKHHRFSPECTKPLVQLYNCALCGGMYRIKPCLFYCLNILRGCFADLADIHEKYKLMVKAMSVVPNEILGSFQPEVFIQDSLIHLVHLIEDLKERDLKTEISSACVSERGGVVRRRRRSGFFNKRQATTSDGSSASYSQSVNQLVSAFNSELQCMDNIRSLLEDATDYMCYQSKQHKTIADTGNRLCWMGSQMGTYYHQEVRFTKEDQVNNPEFNQNPNPPYLNQFTDLTLEISMITAEINETLDSDLCLDDEDCTTAPFYVCEEDPKPEGSGGSGGSSGSGGSGGSEGSGESGDSEETEAPRGSGSGLGSGSGKPIVFDDTEEGEDDIDVGITDSIINSTDSIPSNYTTPNTTSGSGSMTEGDNYSVIDISPGGNDTTNTSLPEEPEVSFTFPQVSAGVGLSTSSLALLLLSVLSLSGH